MENLNIRIMECKDVDAVVNLYQRYMNNPFFEHLGKSFLEILWNYLITTELSINLVLEDKDRNKVVGYITGVIDCVKVFRIFLIKEALALIKINFLKFSNISKNLRLLLELNSYHKNTILNSIKAQILSVIVHPKYRGGKGEELTRTLLEEFKKKNIFKVKATILKDNSISNQLLRNFGFKLEKLFNFYNYKICLYSFRF